MPIRAIFDVPPKILDGLIGDMYYVAKGGQLTVVSGLPATSINGYVPTLQADGSVKWLGGNASISTIIGDGVNTVPTGFKGFIEVPFDATIIAVRLLANASGSIVIDLWKSTYAAFPPTVANTITASAKPTITSAQKSENTTLSGWTKTLTAGDILGVNVNSATTIKQVTMSLTVQRR